MIGIQQWGDELVKSQKASVFVIPANAGIQGNQVFMDPRFRRGDGLGDFLRGITFYFAHNPHLNQEQSYHSSVTFSRSDCSRSGALSLIVLISFRLVSLNPGSTRLVIPPVVWMISLV